MEINWNLDPAKGDGSEFAEATLTVQGASPSKRPGNGPGYRFQGLEGFWNTRRSDAKKSPDLLDAKKGDVVEVTLKRRPKDDGDGYWQDCVSLVIAQAAPGGRRAQAVTSPAAFALKDAQIMRESGVKSLVELASGLLSANSELALALVIKAKTRNEANEVVTTDVDFATYTAGVVDDARRACISLIADAMRQEHEAQAQLTGKQNADTA